VTSADFGISKKFAEGELSQTSGVIALTRKYCAPEVYDGAPRGRAADVFSLGCVFLEIATVIQGRSLDEFADFRARPINPGDDVDDDSYHGNLEKVEDWIENLRLIPDQGLEQRREITRTLDIIRRMIKWVPETRPTTPKVLEQLGGPRNCCVQEREAYEAEEEKTSISDSLRRMA
jgi:serine/threonine protein kinase